MKPLFIFLFSLLFSSVSAQPQTVGKTSEKSDPWKKVDSLSAIGQPRSALDVVNRIYLDAKKANQDAIIIKALIYRAKLNMDFRENSLEKSVGEIKKEMENAEGVQKQILQSILAEIYWKYYETNEYRYRERSRVVNNHPDSLATWDLMTLSRAILKNYLLSLSTPETLQKTAIGKYKAILNTDFSNDNKPGEDLEPAIRFQPALFDFLAGRALVFLTSAETGKMIPVNRFEINQPWYFSNTAGFIRNRMMIPEDSTAPASFALQLFRNLAAFHFRDTDRAALIGWELKRVDFVHDQGIYPDKDSLFVSVLGQLQKDESASPYSTLISCKLAEFLNIRGQEYEPLSSENHKWDIKKAVEICDKAIQSYPGSDGAKNCEILRKNVLKPSLQITGERAVPSEKPSLTLLRYKNLKELWFRLIKADPEKYFENQDRRDQEESAAEWLSLAPLKSWHTALPDDGDYQPHSVESAIPETGNGFYILLVSASENFNAKETTFAWMPFWSTRISFINRRTENGGAGFYLLDRITGLPIKNAAAEAWNLRYDYRDHSNSLVSLGNFSSDENGYLEVPPDNASGVNPNIYLKIKYKDDFFITGNFYRWPVDRQPERTYLQTTFFTDRAVYRPGQIICFKGLVTERTGDQSTVKTGYNMTVLFSDVNGRKIADKEVKTNDFGSFSGSFTAPDDVLPGQMTISCPHGSASVRVEYYKLPTFEAIIEPVKGNFSLGENINVSGSAKGYAGNYITNAEVKYTVTRKARFPWFDRFWYRPFPLSPETEIVSGKTTTGENGLFSITFPAIPDKKVEKKSEPVFDFQVKIEVTDPNGEQQLAEQTIAVGYKSRMIQVAIPENVDTDKDTAFKFSVTNLQGQPVPAEINVALKLLQHPDRPYIPRLWSRPDRFLMTREQFHAAFPYHIYNDENEPATWKTAKNIFTKKLKSDSDSTIRLADPSAINLEPGTYLLSLTTRDSAGEQTELKKIITVYSSESKKVPVTDFFWFVPVKTTCEPGEKATFLLGSSEDNLQVLYEITVRDSLVSRQWIKLNNRTSRIEIPVKDEYRGNFAVNFILVHQNRVFQESVLVTVPHTDKKIGIRFETFRDKMQPGEKETWKLKLLDYKGHGVKAEMLATMYDAALDAILPHQFEFDLYRRFSGTNPWNYDQSFRPSSGIMKFSPDMGDVYRYTPQLQLNWFGLSYFGGHIMYDRRMDHGKLRFTAPVSAENAGQNNEAMLFSKAGGPADDLKDKEDNSPATSKPSTLQIRKIFRETAYFYPELRSDTNGELSLQFELPESVTRWKMLGFVHTGDLRYGLVTKELVAQKTLMLFPNVPRFIRQGDTLVFSTRVVNLSDGKLTGSISVDLSDALNLQSLNNLVITENNTGGLFQKFELEKGQNGTVEWKIYIPSSTNLSVLKYRIIANAGSFSDGEEKIIPVLSNRMLVTETLPLPVRGKGSTSFTFSKLVESGKEAGSTMKNYRLTLEFASNPAWYAVQALPSLAETNYETSEAIFSAWWSNQMASYITSSSPEIEAVFNAWKLIAPDAFKSNLEKNENLKSALLIETPWVLDAGSDSERKLKLGMFFDRNRIRESLSAGLQKLIRLQSPSGGWSWMAGMKENRYTTQAIVTGTGKLIHIGAIKPEENPSVKTMMIQAMRYLDEQLVKDFGDVKKYDQNWQKNNHLSSIQVQYLYALSFFPEKTATDIQHVVSGFSEAYNYYMEQASKYWLDQERLTQGMIALALNRAGNKNVASLIIKSLSEKALHSEEMGMYWNPAPGFSWYNAPLETQAMMMEAFDEIPGDLKALEDMKVWLLKQKQTRKWKSDRATLEACYALLLRGSDLLSTETGGEDIRINIGGKTLVPGTMENVRIEPGTGFFELSWNGIEITPEMGKITITKSGKGIAWGAAYWQYFENLDKITPATTPLKIEKQLFVRPEENKQNTSIYKPAESQKLKTGDRLAVRIVVSSDRDMEFVHLKDMRASTLEPVNQFNDDFQQNTALSGYRFRDGLGYYQSTTDQATNFFFDFLPKGTYVFEYGLKVNAAGACSNGISTIQCLYAPEFAAHGEGCRVKVYEK